MGCRTSNRIKIVWTGLALTGLFTAFFTQSASADIKRLYPYTEAAVITSQMNEWVYTYAAAADFKLEGDAIYCSSNDGIDIMEWDPGVAGAIDDAAGSVLKEGVALKKSGFFQGTYEFETKMGGDGSEGQRLVTFFQVESQALGAVGDFRMYRLYMGNPAPNQNYWYLSVEDYDDTANTLTETTRINWPINSPTYDLDVWRHVRIQMYGTTGTNAADPVDFTTKIYVDGNAVGSDNPTNNHIVTRVNLMVGNGYNNDPTMNGLISEVSIKAGSLSIKSPYTSSVET